MLGLRGRTRLTQQQLASRLGVSTRTIQYWETGVSFPAGLHLKGLIAACLENGAFTPGQEQDEARALWESATYETPRLAAPFDQPWFASLLASRHTAKDSAIPPPPRREDWGEAPQLSTLYGRSAELDMLNRWILEERCQLVLLVGMGGIGKTSLATQLATDIASRFDFVYWRSLALGLPPRLWLGRAITHLSENR